MEFRSPLDQVVAAWVAAFWLAGMAGVHWWVALGCSPTRRRPHLRLVVDHGRLIGA